MSYAGLTHLYQMHMIACRLEVYRQEIHKDICLLLVGCWGEVLRQEVGQDICLPLIGTDGKYGGLGLCEPLQNMSWSFIGNPGKDLVRVHFPGLCLIKAYFKYGSKFILVVFFLTGVINNH